MKFRLKRSLIILSIMLTLMAGSLVYGQGERVVTLGNDLDQNQRSQMLKIFGVEEKDVKILVVTNEEERNYLKGIAAENQIGSRSISSAYVEDLEKGEGIKVETYNINWVTAEMYQNALVTAGVTNARVIAAAPFNVSGTAALTGILKAFEEVRGANISEEQKKIANEEMVKTGELGEEIGREKAPLLIKQIKEEIIDRGIKDPEEIKKIVIEIAGRLDINLNVEQIEEITRLMQEITKLNLNTEVIRQQLKGIGERIGEISQQNEEVKGILERILDAIRQFFESLLGMLTNK
ncbi:DUF1002 domain-containing protein [Alkaliphilus hydrothermalis]|uniref:Uncharacterized protein YpuA (DUF1002 family) n=1 Tax=Alkaliphilus hydrothermalis TaxID=1482730 RepID=A0ABS2NQV6_9FIRM|nr:DUF1002 domain-containing protein [Alkaliphilus hydrothermalis]MBM7615329.1 uncharacterized protein YpuA (DUF1002 family) [Alkaliphilus hydrothermalis]